MLAESSIFSMFKHYLDTFVAYRPSEVLLLTKTDLLKLFELDNAILLNYLEYISNSTLTSKSKIAILSLDSIREKISGYLLHEYKMNGSQIITLPFSKKEWAEFINVSRTSLSRELRYMQQEGIISFQKRTIEMKDLDKLEKILSL
ncbi:Crp/Fnr family transcriptional regulator [Anaerosacchariphilus polymeriproducens]|uniref:Crp/Fnr family transcriptional regulator n=1 Tax=Anaerosacchariphilus polymeriproducens TaxID=1812858 RepID=A0A371AYV4_9FIRM|nr:helix-turn-helix domain-containing protein [Anaerosacchariphilus polymeriproducens]RDU24682.1 Crp/Fnr family transcriptional regulator [Anaerosacchariphilus polymeriproducens]